MSTPNSTVSAQSGVDAADGAGGSSSSGPELRVVHAMPAPGVVTADRGDTTATAGPTVPAAGSTALPSTPLPSTALPSTPLPSTTAPSAVSPTAEAAATWLPVAEAAERTSVSESALRKWIKAGELLTRDAPGPRGLRTEVTVEAVVARARQAGMEVGPRAGLDLADAFTRLENLAGQLVAMGERAARAEVERDHVKRRVDELRGDNARAVEGERRRADAERARLDALTAELAAAREALTAERARADAMLAAVPRRKRSLFARPATGVPGSPGPASSPAAAPAPAADADPRSGLGAADR